MSNLEHVRFKFAALPFELLSICHGKKTFPGGCVHLPSSVSFLDAKAGNQVHLPGQNRAFLWSEDHQGGREGISIPGGGGEDIDCNKVVLDRLAGSWVDQVGGRFC
jgi:hypothetical protein